MINVLTKYVNLSILLILIWKKNYKEYILLKKKINPLFKTQYCKKHLQNKCIFRPVDDPIV